MILLSVLILVTVVLVATKFHELSIIFSIFNIFFGVGILTYQSPEKAKK